MHTFLADLRYGARLLRQSPGFTIVSLAALAIGIGANLTIFGFAKELLLSAPPGIADPDRVARVFTNRFSSTSQPNYEAYRDRNHSFVALAAFRRGIGRTFEPTRRPSSCLPSASAGTTFTRWEYPQPSGGRFAPSDDQPGAPGVVVLSDRWWQLRFGGNRAALGQTLTINGRPQTIVGVAPREFTGTMAPLVPDFFMPARTVGSRRSGAASRSSDGSRPGVTLGEAQAELTTLATQLAPAQSDDLPRPMVTVYAARALAPEFALPAGDLHGFAPRRSSVSSCSWRASTSRTCCWPGPRGARVKSA